MSIGRYSVRRVITLDPQLEGALKMGAENGMAQALHKTARQEAAD